MLFAMYKVVQFILNIVQIKYKMLFNINQNITFNLCQNIKQNIAYWVVQCVQFCANCL